jgi:hypothetical protein
MVAINGTPFDQEINDLTQAIASRQALLGEIIRDHVIGDMGDDYEDHEVDLMLECTELTACVFARQIWRGQQARQEPDLGNGPGKADL